MTPKIFHVASFLGLLPAQCLATYLGSTLRSMEDVLSDHSHATTGILVLCIQVSYDEFLNTRNEERKTQVQLKNVLVGFI